MARTCACIRSRTGFCTLSFPTFSSHSELRTSALRCNFCTSCSFGFFRPFCLFDLAKLRQRQQRPWTPLCALGAFKPRGARANAPWHMDASGKPELVRCIFNSKHNRLSTSDPLCGCSLVRTMMASCIPDFFDQKALFGSRRWEQDLFLESMSSAVAQKFRRSIDPDPDWVAKKYTAAKCAASYQRAPRLPTCAANLRATSCGNSDCTDCPVVTSDFLALTLLLWI